MKYIFCLKKGEVNVEEKQEFYMPVNMPPTKSKSVQKLGRKTLSLELKLEVLRRVDAGQRIAHICAAMNLAKSTVQTVRNNKEQILTQFKSLGAVGSTAIVRNRPSIMDKMESLLITWINDNIQRNLPVSALLIQEKAKSIFQTLDSIEPNDNVSFAASRGWYEKFKNRFKLRNIKSKDQRASTDIDSAHQYQETLKQIIGTGGYVPEQVFNVEETDLFWKSMPSNNVLEQMESMRGCKVSKERLSLQLGANAAGNFKLKPLLIYKYETPTAFRNVDTTKLPVIWRSSTKARLTPMLFSEWFKMHFCPAVKAFLANHNLPSKALLLLDHAPSHPEDLSDPSGEIRVEFLPKNSTRLLQPMNQGVISTFKAYYLEKTLRLLNTAENDWGVVQFWKSYNIKEAVNLIEQSWHEVKPTTLNNAWRNLWPDCIANQPETKDIGLPPIVDLAECIGLNDCTIEQVNAFINSDKVPLPNEEIMEIDDKSIKQEDIGDVETPSQILPINAIEEHLSKLDDWLDELKNVDPDQQRCQYIVEEIKAVVITYKQMFRPTKQQTD